MIVDRSSSPVVTGENRLLIGRIHHIDSRRALEQRTQLNVLIPGLLRRGFQVEEATAHYQPDFPQTGRITVRDCTDVAVTHWSQHMHVRREMARRREAMPSIPKRIRGYWRLTRRFLALFFQTGSLQRAIRRRNIERSLGAKHLHLWTCLANSTAMGAVIVEDDFSLRTESSPDEVADLLNEFGTHIDWIDLAGGISRKGLVFPDSRLENLVLSYICTNTTCGYFVSKRMAIALIDLISERPSRLFLGSFVTNELNNAGFRGSSVLPMIPPFIHGTLTGGMTSSIPY